jgi:hypothetical protein
MALADDIKALNESARKVHGSDISITVARSVAFGNDDNLILVMGKNHINAALDVVRAVGKGAKIAAEESTEFMGRKTQYSSVSF